MSKIRVLQCVYSMNRGGVETWLINVLRNIDRTRFQMDFVTFSGKEGAFDKEILELGSRMFPCSPPSRLWRHARDFRAILQDYGPYDVVHSHDQTWNGPILFIAKRFGIPIRITHSHNNIQRSLPHGLLKYLYMLWSIKNSKCCATHGFACSRLAAETYLGKNWRKNPRWKVFYCGEDFSPFAETVDSCTIRKSLRLPPDAVVIGHVGSFRNKGKNHTFIIRTAQELANVDRRIHFLLVGDGILRTKIETQAAKAGLKDRFVFTGTRADVPRLMLGAMDLFLFPSLHEGLGLAMVEAQAAGLPVICSDTIPQDTVLTPDLCRKMSLSQSPADWAKVILQTIKADKPISKKDALSIVTNSQFNIANSIKKLENLYSLKNN
jgi:glycosyltransferase involved in cell wall biosynthesis